MNHSFTSWFRHRHGMNDVRPEAEKVVPMVAAAGLVGMNRKQLSHAIRLDRPVLDELLGGLVSAGLLSVAWGNGVPVFRTQKGRG